MNSRRMDFLKYLNRINFFDRPDPTQESLIRLHQNHLFHIPYENLDIRLGEKILLEEKKIFEKVINQHRGGFCYELNYLFFRLLMELNFNAKLISARIFKEGEPGPEGDHMAIVVEIEGEKWLCDVGFGDLFLKPLKFDFEIPQPDGNYVFKLQQLDETSYLLFISEDGLTFEKKYIFDLEDRKLEDFIDECEYKQTSPASYFVENNICSIPTKTGRKTIFNSKYTEKINGEKLETMITSVEQEDEILKKEFNIMLNRR